MSDEQRIASGLGGSGIVEGDTSRVEDSTDRQRIEQLNAQLVKMEQEVSKIVAACMQYEQAIRQHAQMLDVAMKRLHFNLRVTAAEMAVRAKGPGDQQKNVIEGAAKWYEFLTQQDESGRLEVEDGEDQTFSVKPTAH